LNKILIVLKLILLSLNQRGYILVIFFEAGSAFSSKVLIPEVCINYRCADWWLAAWRRIAYIVWWGVQARSLREKTVEVQLSVPLNQMWLCLTFIIMRCGYKRLTLNLKHFSLMFQKCGLTFSHKLACVKRLVLQWGSTSERCRQRRRRWFLARYIQVESLTFQMAELLCRVYIGLIWEIAG